MLVLTLLVASASADDSSCEQVRSVRQMAVAAALDTTTLDVLEQRMCGKAAAAPASGACADLVTTYWLGFIDKLPDDDLALVQSATDSVCQRGAAPPARWSNGLTAVGSDGSIRYPSGIHARGADGSWQWPSGITARRTDGSWQYPSGMTAMRSDGSFQKPDGLGIGDAQALVEWSCARHADACEILLPKIGELEGEAELVVIIGLGWFAGKR